MSVHMGIDIAKDSFEVHLLIGDEAPESADFDNSPSGFKKLRRFVKKRNIKQLHACMEATGRYGEALAEFLYEQGFEVSVVNPARIKAYGQSQLRRNKTDRLDAALIADFCRSQKPPLWTPPPPHWRELQGLVRHLADLEVDRQRQRNRLDALQHSASPSAIVQANLQQQIQFLSEQIQHVKNNIQDHIDQHPDLKRERDLLVSIKGVGRLTAAKLMAEFRAITHFDDVRQLVAFAGLNPKHRQSGSSIKGRTRISKMGRASIRATLYMPAVVARQHNPILKSFADRLQQRGLNNMEIIVAVMRKLLHLAFGILKSGRPFDPHYLESQA